MGWSDPTILGRCVGGFTQVFIEREPELIIQNAFRVKETGEIFRSCHVHDFKGVLSSSGPHAYVDGGDAYFRSSGLDDPRIENLCLTTAHSKEGIRKKLLWGTRGKSGKDPLKWVVLNECETAHLEAILRECKPAKIYRETIEAILAERKNGDAIEWEALCDRMRILAARLGLQVKITLDVIH